jgi:hypothetical protein
MKNFAVYLFCGILLIGSNLTVLATEKLVKTVTDNQQGCLFCHQGIEAFTEGLMMTTIKAMGKPYGDPAGCVICHGGNPQATTKKRAHQGSPARLIEATGPQMFYPDPGSLWINEFTCGQCHRGVANRLKKALMNTEAGKLQGNFWSWGLQKSMKTVWGNYAIKDEDGATPAIGTDAYKVYMKKMLRAHPDQFPTELKPLPEVNVKAISKQPNLAGITYSRQECQRCHVGSTGRKRRGDYRGTGCSACHVPYSNEGFYEGGDPTINQQEPGHVLVHRLQATRKSKVHVGAITYSGIPSETCNTCHNRGKRIGVNYQGLMEFSYGSPYDDKGNKQPPLHTKKYLFIKDDLHHQIASRAGNPQGGLLCQDCHTSIDIHGDGNIAGTTLAQVEIECSDCHGTPDKFPWELPLGYGEEFNQPLAKTARGLATELPNYMRWATLYEPEDGYLLTARGNPFGNVVKKGDEVIIHSASGLDFKIPILKKINTDNSWKSLDAHVAMGQITAHLDNMECYACHADWVPQCYGCHITVDYSNGKTSVDWIKTAHSRGKNGMTANPENKTNASEGKVSETRSYLRWETPILGINGEGRVTPMMPGCQVITTVIDKDGKTVVKNKIWTTPEGPGLDMAAVQPHTTGRKARSCASCHNNPKTLGYGIEGGRFTQMNKDRFIDLETATGQVIPANTQVQMPAIPDLKWDLSQIITREGKQLVSVGSHWPLTAPLSQTQRDKMERTQVCVACHKEMSNAQLWNKISTKQVLNDEMHTQMLNTLIHQAGQPK